MEQLFRIFIAFFMEKFFNVGLWLRYNFTSLKCWLRVLFKASTFDLFGLKTLSITQI